MVLDMKIEEMKKIYPQYENNKKFYDERIKDVEKGFINQFGDDNNIRFFSAPGRIEIGGNHTDHQRGCVLAAGIDLDVIGAAVKTEGTIINIYSKGYGLLSIDVSDLSIKEEEKNTTNALIRGVYSKITTMNYKLSGMNIYCLSNVLSGSGLSSSAAFEVFLGTIINNLFCNNEISAVEIAKIGQYAENAYFGKPCGLMDQMASSVSNVVSIDFKDPENPVIEQIDFLTEDMKHAICIIDSGADHADLTNEYAEITEEMGRVSAIFNKQYLREVTKEEIINNAALICEKAGDRAYLRALHFQNENQRALLEALALKEKDYDKFLELVTESGFSSFMYLQNIFAVKDIHNQKVAVALSLCQELLQGKGAFRVHGGGFAGTVQAFVPFEMLEMFKEKIEAVLGKDMCYILSIRQVGGVEIK